ncbi:MAG: anti-sigma factor family protein [Terriglobales bacterium]
MKCNEVCELMPDLAAGMGTSTPEVDEHLKSCAACAGKLAEVRQTLALLDEWRAPEPSPYFDTRMMARLREEKGQPRGWWQWMRKPALAVSLGVLMVMSVTLFRNDAGLRKHNDGQVVAAVAEPGTAVGDLSAMDKNSELYSDFDVLDDLQVQQDVNANP